MGVPIAPLRVAVLGYPGVDALDLFGAYSVLAKAAEVPPGLEVCLAARGRWLRTSAGVRVAPTASLDAVAGADAVVVPGGAGAARAAADAALLALLQAAASRGVPLYGVCSGTLLIAAAGLAAGRRVAVHHRKQAQLRAYGVGAVVSGLVRDGAVCTVGGDRRESVKSVDLAFALLADIAPAAVEPVAARLEISPGRRHQ